MALSREFERKELVISRGIFVCRSVYHLLLRLYRIDALENAMRLCQDPCKLIQFVIQGRHTWATHSPVQLHYDSVRF